MNHWRSCQDTDSDSVAQDSAFPTQTGHRGFTTLESLVSDAKSARDPCLDPPCTWDTGSYPAGVQALRFGSTDLEVKGGSGHKGGRNGGMVLARAQKMGPDTSCDRCYDTKGAQKGSRSSGKGPGKASELGYLAPTMCQGPNLCFMQIAHFIFIQSLCKADYKALLTYEELEVQSNSVNHPASQQTHCGAIVHTQVCTI